MKNKHAVALGRKGGKSTTTAKARAARANGKKGGRPNTRSAVLLSQFGERVAAQVEATAAGHYARDIRGELAFRDWRGVAQAIRESQPIAVSSPLARALATIAAMSLILFTAAPARAQSLKLPAVVFGAAGAADIATTAWFLSDNYGIREINPAVNWIKNPTLMLTFGAVVETTVATLIVRKLEKRHRRLAAFGLYAAAGVHAYFAIHNARLMHGRQPMR